MFTQFLYALLGLVAVLATATAAISGAALVVNPKNTDALLLFLPALIISSVSLYACWRNKEARIWLLSWLIPF